MRTASSRFATIRNAVATSCTAALLATIGLLASAPPARSAVVQRCSNGGNFAIYTDGACAAIGARPAPMRVELLNRLASEARIEGNPLESTALVPADGTPAARGPSRRSAADGCARTPGQLAKDLRGSFALGDVNRLAESYHWAGMSTRAGERTLDRLGGLIGRHAVASRYYAAQIASLGDADWTDGATDAVRGGDAGILQVVFAGDGVQQAVEFDVHRYRGCYFVSF